MYTYTSWVNGCIQTGLTVTVVKEASTGDFALEAGALVLGDQVWTPPQYCRTSYMHNGSRP